MKRFAVILVMFSCILNVNAKFRDFLLEMNNYTAYGAIIQGKVWIFSVQINENILTNSCVTIPGHIEWRNKVYEVSYVNWFCGVPDNYAKFVKSIVLPNTVTNVDIDGFSKFFLLEEINTPSSLTKKNIKREYSVVKKSSKSKYLKNTNAHFNAEYAEYIKNQWLDRVKEGVYDEMIPFDNLSYNDKISFEQLPEESLSEHIKSFLRFGQPLYNAHAVSDNEYAEIMAAKREKRERVWSNIANALAMTLGNAYQPYNFGLNPGITSAVAPDMDLVAMKAQQRQLDAQMALYGQAGRYNSYQFEQNLYQLQNESLQHQVEMAQQINMDRIANGLEPLSLSQMQAIANNYNNTNTSTNTSTEGTQESTTGSQTPSSSQQKCAWCNNTGQYIIEQPVTTLGNNNSEYCSICKKNTLSGYTHSHHSCKCGRPRSEGNIPTYNKVPTALLQK